MAVKSSKNSIQKVILDKINKGEVRMRPRFYFILRIILLVAGIIIIFSAGVYFISFIMFVMSQSGLLFLPAFGFWGFRILFSSLPWLLIIIIMGFVGLLEVLVKKYSIAYRKPLLYSAFIIIALVLATGFMIQKTPFHGRILERSQRRPMPVVRPFYSRFAVRDPKNVHAGIVSKTTKEGFVLELRNGEDATVIVSKKTDFRGEDKNMKKGDVVIVLGEIKDGIIKAVGVHRPPKDEKFNPTPIPGEKNPEPPPMYAPPN